jgi:hypothetical protein
LYQFENGRLVEHWDVLQDETTRAQSKSGLPMFGEEFSTEGEIKMIRKIESPL